MTEATSKNQVSLDENINWNIYPLFQNSIPQDGDLKMDRELRVALARAIADSGKKRSHICAEIFDLIQIDAPVTSLDSWIAESKSKSSQNEDQNNNKRWGILAEVVPAFCYVTGDNRPLELMLNKIGLKLMTLQQQNALDLIAMKEKRKLLDKEIRNREAKLKKDSKTI